MTQVTKRLTCYCPKSPEILLILGLILLNIGCFVGRVETVDAWCLYVVHLLDVRYWTWKSYSIILAILTVFLFRSRKQGNKKCYAALATIVFLIAILTVWHGIIEYEWNRNGRTFIVRQMPKGTKSVHDYAPLDYKVHVPIGFYSIGGRRPLIIFLHGSGRVGKDIEDNIEDLTKHLSPEMKKDFPFVVISPVCRKHGWKTSQIQQILAETTTRWNIDPSRIYLTGMSMGGFGTFQIACETPETFAAIVPVAGGGDPSRAERLKSVPTWAFHGDLDDVVAYECSSNMIEAMQKSDCCEAKLTTLQGAGHGIMQPVYSRPDLYQWLLKHRK